MKRATVATVARLAMAVALWVSIMAWPAGAQSAQSPWPRPGFVSLSLAPEASSTVNLDLTALGESACQGSASGVFPRAGGGEEECRLVVGNGGNGSQLGDEPPSGFDLRLLARSFTADRGGCGSWVEVEPDQLWLTGSAPLELACGSFPFEITLGHRTQPLSSLHLLPADGGSQSGFFVGRLAMAAEVRLVGAGGASLPTVPLQLDLELAGRWTALDPFGGPGLQPSESTLVLLVERAATGWVGKPSCGQDRARCARLCLEASEAGLARLNDEGDPTQ